VKPFDRKRDKQAAELMMQHPLKSSCNFSLGCHESSGLPLGVAVKMTRNTRGPQAKGNHHTKTLGKQRPHGVSSGATGQPVGDGSQKLLKHIHQQQSLVRPSGQPNQRVDNTTERLFYQIEHSSAHFFTGQQFKHEHNHAHHHHYHHHHHHYSTFKLPRFNQTETANAMVGLVRIILVILICVLLVKLHAIPNLVNLKSSSSLSVSGRQQQRGAKLRRRRNSARLFMVNNHLIEQDNDTSITSSNRETERISLEEEEQQEKQVQEDEQSSRRNIEHRNQTNLEKLINNFSILIRTNRILNSNMLPQRRFSQPVISMSTNLSGESINQEINSQQTQQSNMIERRRRFSDTNAIISSMRLPPGPMGLPFLGYLPFLGPEIHLTLTKLSQRFGPIYQIFLGGIRVVVLNDAALVRQAFKQTVFSGRPDTQLTRILQGYGIVNSDGALWKEQRAFLHSALRKLGAKSLMSGTNGLEAKIQVSSGVISASGLSVAQCSGTLELPDYVVVVPSCTSGRLFVQHSLTHYERLCLACAPILSPPCIQLSIQTSLAASPQTHTYTHTSTWTFLI